MEVCMYVCMYVCMRSYSVYTQAKHSKAVLMISWHGLDLAEVSQTKEFDWLILCVYVRPLLFTYIA